MSAIEYIKKVITEKNPGELKNLNFHPGQNFDFLTYVIEHEADFNFALNDNQWLEIIKPHNPTALLAYLGNDVRISPKVLMSIIENSDLTATDEEGWTALHIVLRTNTENEYYLGAKQIDYLIKHSNLMQLTRDDSGDNWNAAMFAFYYNKNEQLNLSHEQIDYLLKNSDLDQTAADGYNTAMSCIINNKKQNLNLTGEQLDYIFKNVDLKKVTKNYSNLAMICIRENKEQNLNLSESHITYLLENSDLSQTKDGFNIAMCAFNAEQNLRMTDEHFAYLIKNSNLSYVNGSEDLLQLAIRRNVAMSIDNWKLLITGSAPMTKKDFNSLCKSPELKATLESMFTDEKKSFFNFIKFKKILREPTLLSAISGDVSYREELLKIHSMVSTCIDLKITEADTYKKVFNELLIQCQEDSKISKVIDKANPHIPEAIHMLHSNVEELLLKRASVGAQSVKSLTKYLRS